MSLPTDYISDLKNIIDSIGANLPGYKPRQSQKKMIAAVAEVLSHAAPVPEKVEGQEKEPMPENTGKSILLCQAPTGVGKSLSYLIGAAVPAVRQGRKIVVSSATVALQEQLVTRDVPFFLQHSGLDMKCAIAKGRGRYVCHAKLRRAAGVAEQDDLFGETSTTGDVTVSDKKTFIKILNDYETKAWSGDRDELPASMPDKAWSQVTTDRHGCLNKKCPNYDTCAQMAARASIRSADIVIANHDLLLADISLGGGVILPSPEESIYILDEGHHIAQKAVDTFAHHHQVDAGRLMMEKLAALSDKLGQSFYELSPQAAKIGEEAEYLSEGLEEAYTMFGSIGEAAFESGIWRFPNNKMPMGSESLVSNITKSAAALLSALGEVRESLVKEDSLIGQKFLSDFGFYASKVEAILETWLMLEKNPEIDEVPIAKWLAIEKKPNGRIDYVVNASPVVAGTVLANSFFKKAAGVVVTSATLMTMGNFDQMLSETGLELLPDTHLLSLPSPFNHAEQGVLCIPNIGASAKNQAQHTLAIIAALPELFAQTGNKGTLMLFASRKQMMDVAEGLPECWRKLVLIQGSIPKDALLSEHHTRIINKTPSILFGLQSFSEGLDLPGDDCYHVIIAKLPFSTPNDPIQMTLSTWLESQGRSYFNEIAVPQTCLRMIQSAGRLIRTETDTGILTVLDERLSSTRYGRQIRDALPPFKRAA